MSLTASEIARLDKMCPVAQGSTLGTELGTMQTNITNLQAVAGGSGEYTVLSADDTAGTVDIDTGLTAIAGFIVQIYRAGVNVMQDAVVTVTGGVMTVADGASTYALTADDVINYMVW